MRAQLVAISVRVNPSNIGRSLSIRSKVVSSPQAAMAAQAAKRALDWGFYTIPAIPRMGRRGYPLGLGQDIGLGHEPLQFSVMTPMSGSSAVRHKPVRPSAMATRGPGVGGAAQRGS